MLAAHNDFLEDLSTPIRAQLENTIEATESISGPAPPVEVNLGGGVLQSPYISAAVKSMLRSNWSHAFPGGFDCKVVEQAERSTVANGAIICLNQPHVGGRHTVKEGYGSEITVQYDATKHDAHDMSEADRSDIGSEVRNRIEWAIPIVSLHDCCASVFSTDCDT